MGQVVITGNGTAKAVKVSDVSDAVRKVSTELRKVATDASVLRSLQTWADAGFKKPLRLTVGGQSIVVDYRE